MAGAISLCFRFSVASSAGALYRSNRSSIPAKPTTKISCIGWVFISLFYCPLLSNLVCDCVCFCGMKDPEGILGPPSTGHIARREFQRRLERDADAREEFQRQILEEKERLRNLRDVKFVFFFIFSIPFSIFMVFQLGCVCFSLGQGSSG